MQCKNLFLFIFTFLYLIFPAQKVQYDIPDMLKSEINMDKYKLIVDLAVLEISKHEKVLSVENGIFKTDKHTNYGIDNLIYKSKDINEKAALNSIIKEHFNALFDSINFSDNLDLKNFEKIRQYLSLRLYPKSYFEEYLNNKNCIYKIDLEDVYTVLMLDLPTAFTNVQREAFESWKKNELEVFSIAQENINKQNVEKVTQTFEFGGTNVQINFIGDETYAASYGLDLIHNSPDFVGNLGAVVAFPNKGIINVCKITNDHPLDFVKFIQGTKSLVKKFHDDHPYPVSTDFFWYYKGKFKKINVFENSDGKIDVTAPNELSDLLVKLK